MGASDDHISRVGGGGGSFLLGVKIYDLVPLMVFELKMTTVTGILDVYVLGY